MKVETSGHIETAGRNREIAWVILSLTGQTALSWPPYEWAAVVAFYSAVHYINAYTWELHGVEHRHPQRRQFVATTPPLAIFLQEYVQVEDHAWAARYVPGHRLYGKDARDLLNNNLALIEATVCRELGINPP